MSRALRFLAAFLTLGLAALPPGANGAASRKHSHAAEPPQDTGFLNRRVELKGVSYRFQVYLPEEWRRDDGRRWPVILFLHGRGERGSEGMWQTQIGLPAAVRDHPERWPFVIVMPQCPQNAHWTDPLMMKMAMAALDRESAEFHGDPDRTYLTGLSLGGYGVWELARQYPRRWAAIAVAAGGIFWSYQPDRWRQSATLPAEYARAVGATPVWMFHGSIDPLVKPQQDELLYEALRTAGGHVRLWLYQGVRHDCWSRAYNEPELPRWLLAHRLPLHQEAETAERVVVPLHPPAIRLTQAQIDNLTGEYMEPNGRDSITLYRQGEQLFEKNQYGDVTELAAETPELLFYPGSTSSTRILVERDRQGRIVALRFRDDRHEERWEKEITASRK